MLFKLVEHNDINNIKKLVDVAFGLNYLSLQTITNHINSKDCYSFCLSDNNVFVGFIFLKLHSATSINDCLLNEYEWFLTYFKGYKNIAIVEQIAIVNEYRGKKLSHQLLIKSLDFIEEKCDIVISVCWLKKELTPMARLLKRNNFYPIKTLSNYWKEDSLEKEYNCTICGSPPCKCSAEIYELKKPFRN